MQSHIRVVCYPCNNRFIWYTTKILNNQNAASVNCCWSSPAQSFLVSSPVGTNDQISIRFKTVYVFVYGVISSTRGGVGLSE
jgi:hypothetical protein